MEIRKFLLGDAEFCFKIRSTIFIEKFYSELSPEVVTAAVNAYLPNDYIRMSREKEFFIVEENGLPVGFFTIERKDTNMAEIPLIYIDLNHLRKGIGKACILFIEEWLLSNWKEVEMLIVDTIIPKYNSGFYQRVGFIPTEKTLCDFPNLRVKAVRFCKVLK